ncbi:unnamed protein product, partial [marine sediment metagenome]
MGKMRDKEKAVVGLGLVGLVFGGIYLATRL